jgi:hypothetical protein
MVSTLELCTIKYTIHKTNVTNNKLNLGESEDVEAQDQM